MNVKIDKPIRRGEVRHGVLTREQNGVVCFDETDQGWLNNPVRRSVQLKRFPLGTRVVRKRDEVRITLTVSLAELDGKNRDTLDSLEYCNELSDAVIYAMRYAERRRR